jgi:hypothetical protein
MDLHPDGNTLMTKTVLPNLRRNSATEEPHDGPSIDRRENTVFPPHR